MATYCNEFRLLLEASNCYRGQRDVHNRAEWKLNLGLTSRVCGNTRNSVNIFSITFTLIHNVVCTSGRLPTSWWLLRSSREVIKIIPRAICPPSPAVFYWLADSLWTTVNIRAYPGSRLNIPQPLLVLLWWDKTPESCGDKTERAWQSHCYWLLMAFSSWGITLRRQQGLTADYEVEGHSHIDYCAQVSSTEDEASYFIFLKQSYRQGMAY